MGKSGYGVWVLVASFAVTSGYLSLLDPGIQGATVKFVAQHHATGEEEQLRKTVWTSLLFHFSLGLGSSAFLTFFGVVFATKVFNIPAELCGAVQVLFGLRALQGLFDFPKLTCVAVYSGLERYDLLRLVQIGFDAISAALTVLFLALGYGVTSAGAASLLGSILSFGVLTLGLRRLLPASIWRIPGDWQWKDAKPLLRLGSGLFGFRMTGIVFRQVDKLVIPIILTSTSLTPYSVANYFYQVSASARGFVSSNFVPVASSLAALHRKTRLKDAFLRGTRFTLALTMPVAMVGVWLAEPAVTYWVGKEHIEAASLARILLVINFFAATSVVGFNVMIGMNKIRGLLMINLASAVLKILLSIGLTHFFGLIGTAVATLLSQLMTWYPYNHLYLKTLQIPWSEYFKEAISRPYLVAVMLFAVIWMVNPFVKPTSLVETIVMGGVAIAFYLAAFSVIGLDGVEREKAWTWLKSYSARLGRG
jgi:O-antigen/teichoic acid export membrane protein